MIFLMVFSGIPYFRMIKQRLSRWMESNTFSKFMKFMYKLACHSLTCSTMFLKLLSISFPNCTWRHRDYSLSLATSNLFSNEGLHAVQICIVFN